MLKNEKISHLGGWGHLTLCNGIFKQYGKFKESARVQLDKFGTRNNAQSGAWDDYGTRDPNLNRGNLNRENSNKL